MLSSKLGAVAATAAAATVAAALLYRIPPVDEKKVQAEHLPIIPPEVSVIAPSGSTPRSTSPSTDAKTTPTRLTKRERLTSILGIDSVQAGITSTDLNGDFSGPPGSTVIEKKPV